MSMFYNVSIPLNLKLFSGNSIEKFSGIYPASLNFIVYLSSSLWTVWAHSHPSLWCSVNAWYVKPNLDTSYLLDPLGSHFHERRCRVSFLKIAGLQVEFWQLHNSWPCQIISIMKLSSSMSLLLIIMRVSSNNFELF